MLKDSWHPNWRNPEEYPDPEDASITNERWAWEFLRRNDEYAAVTERVFVACGSLADDKDRDEWLEDDGELYRGVYYHIDDGAEVINDSICRKYLVETLYPPSTPPDRVGFRYDYVPEYLCYEAANSTFDMFQAHNNSSNLSCDDWSEVLIKFRLDLNFKEQLECAKYQLDKLQNAFGKKGLIDLPTDQNVQDKNYRNYLRMLDGIEQGTSQIDIGRILFPHPEGGSRKAAKELSEFHKNAIELTKNKYKILLYHSPKSRTKIS